ncbi:hypothetical protein NQ314_009002 [Rhamnusium bicolor]|uniref:Uncharacterized protein n=1 Tax=Rhamnusium bicolor TaxID=1586634 RepID=A0AAV8Y6X4_9CUCU|nr:hypothetical protein NQ314_009002 [Rhamnusium bicolor]
MENQPEKNAVDYVQLKRLDGLCELKCTITLEHRITKKVYLCQVLINELEERVESCKCEDCAIAEGMYFNYFLNFIGIYF